MTVCVPMDGERQTEDTIAVVIFLNHNMKRAVVLHTLKLEYLIIELFYEH